MSFLRVVTLLSIPLCRFRNRALCSLLPTKEYAGGVHFPDVLGEKKQMRPLLDCLRSSVPGPRPSQSLHMDSKYLIVNCQHNLSISWKLLMLAEKVRYNNHFSPFPFKRNNSTPAKFIPAQL